MKKIKVIKNRVSQEMNLSKTAFNLRGGQVSKEDRIVFQDEEGKLWRIKNGGSPGYTLREYLGFTAYRALGVRMPNFCLGKDENDIYVLLQEFLLDEDESRLIKTCGSEILREDILEKSVPIIIASVLLGDTDVIGTSGDNILFELDKANGLVKDLINIDCGRTFEYLKNKWVQDNKFQGHFNALFAEYLKRFISIPKFRFFTLQFLQNLDLETLDQALKVAFEDFENFTRNTWVSKFVKQAEKRFYNSEDIGTIALIMGDNSHGDLVQSIDHLITLVKENKSSLTQLFSLKDKVAFDYISIEGNQQKSQYEHSTFDPK